jgi:hypothetical protein
MNHALRARAAVLGGVAMLALTFGAGPFAVIGCGSSSSTGGTPADGGGSDALSSQNTETGTGQDGGTDAATAGTGTGTVTGTIDGAPYGNAGGALWAGAPDDPATTVVYVFSNPVACSFLQNIGWDTKIPDGTKVLEMKSFGTAPGDFKVVTTLTPAPGEASVNYTLSSQSGTPKEQGSTAGTVTLTKLTPNTSATGSFSLTFGASTLTGTFDAVFCPGGHEP